MLNVLLIVSYYEVNEEEMLHGRLQPLLQYIKSYKRYIFHLAISHLLHLSIFLSFG